MVGALQAPPLDTGESALVLESGKNVRFVFARDMYQADASVAIIVDVE